jgi:hypothetical protein
VWDFFWDRVWRTICLGWHRTAILLISASWVDRVTGVSHWSLAFIFLLLSFWRFQHSRGNIAQVL